jgi:hypothetical protein
MQFNWGRPSHCLLAEGAFAGHARSLAAKKMSVLPIVSHAK